MLEPMVWNNLFNLQPNDPKLEWQPFRAGVDILPLYRNEQTECFCALLRYQANAVIPEHEHIGVEHLLILQGSQQDERGSYPAGTLLINPPATSHSVQSPEGCMVLAIWEKPVRFNSSEP